MWTTTYRQFVEMGTQALVTGEVNDVGILVQNSTVKVGVQDTKFCI